jgi:HEAT repeat protein
MRTRRRLFLALAAAGVCALGIFLLTRPNPGTVIYNGKSLTDWGMQFYSPDPKAREEASAAFRAMNTNAVPPLVWLLRAKDTPSRRLIYALGLKLSQPWRRKVLLKAGPLQAESLHCAAARGLGAIGPEARGAIPALADAMRGSELQLSWEAAAALGHIGKDCVPELIGTLQHTNPIVRQAATSALTAIGPDAAPAVPALIPLLGERDEGLRSWVIACLKSIGQPALPALLQTIESQKGLAQRSAAKALIGMYVSRRSGAGPPLLKMLQDEDPASRQQALETLAAIPVRDSDMAAGIAVALNDPVLEVRVAATNAVHRVIP